MKALVKYRSDEITEITYGNAASQLGLGLTCLFGCGQKKDTVLALEWIRRSAEQGHINGIFWLGMMIANGFGTGRNWPDAWRLFRLAADCGHPEAMRQLGRHYLAKQEPDYHAGLQWLRKAASLNHIPALEDLNRLQNTKSFGK